ncbi:MAG: 4Fe-4S binding protein [Deltaproteobacteria bacterium]
MKAKRKIIEIDENLCDGCGLCVPSCAEGAIQVIDGKARIVADKYCDGLGACLGECPKGALRIVDRETEPFDQAAAEKHAASQKSSIVSETIPMACGCPSTMIRTFPTPGSCEKANEPVSQAGGVSALSHWPVQIRLVPPTAPFLKGADLLVAADCTPFAYPRFHEDFLKGKALLVGCPKLDDAQAYVQKFAEIFREADIKSITVLVMEVPCCQGLPVIIQRGMAMAGKNVPMEKVVISSRGEVIEKVSIFSR